MTKRVSCGFNLRIHAGFDENPAHWNWFMLGTDNLSLISADTMVWIVPDEVDSLIQDDTKKFWNPLGLASDLNLLLRACCERNIPVSSLSPICLTVSEEVLAGLIKRSGRGYFENAPSEDELLSSGWMFLGLDIVQLNGLYSGLKGIGYKEPSWSKLRARFGSALNEVGLFSDEAIASQFAEMRGIEIPTHGPFDVVGVLIHDPVTR